MPVSMRETQPGWWISLKHGGMLISPRKVAEFFDRHPPDMLSYLID